MAFPEQNAQVLRHGSSSRRRLSLAYRWDLCFTELYGIQIQSSDLPDPLLFICEMGRQSGTLQSWHEKRDTITC